MQNKSNWGKMTLLWLAACFFYMPASQAKVVLPAIFSSNMVLQQKAKVKFWGTAEPNRMVTVFPSWGQKKYTAPADGKGNWQVTVPTPKAGRGFAISFTDGEELTLTNVLVGEVWVASGQSNMEMKLVSRYGKVVNADQEIAAAQHPDIRFLSVDQVIAHVPQQEARVSGGGWQVCSPQTVINFSAAAYFFARKLQAELGVPVGIISTSWGGTVAEAWTSAASLKTMPEFASRIPLVEKNAGTTKTNKELQQEYEKALQAFRQNTIDKDQGYQNGKPLWAQPNLPTSAWKTLAVPGLWEHQGILGFNGVLWLRKKVQLPASWAGKEATLSLGLIDDEDITYFNGQQIGATQGRTKSRTYKIPAELVKAGENMLAVRISDNTEEGGMHGTPAQLFLVNAANEKISLAASDWAYQAGLDFATMPPPSSSVGANQVTVLYNSMIHPFTQLPVKGVLWYQGESNARRAHQYRTLFPLLIKDWRRHWNQKKLPFYFVQLANHLKREEQPSESAWAELREAQQMALQLPHTGMAVAIDIGEANDIHPKNKQDVGLRLALAALGNTYKKKLAYSGPIYHKMKVRGSCVELRFKHTQGGLQAKDGMALKGFAVAGPDQKFYWAEARIEGKKVVVSSPQVPKPVAVRYGWANNPDVNLTNSSGLPASPFRTDDWPGVTFGSK